MELLVPLIVLALCWVVLILPQRRRVQAHGRFVAGLAVGDEVITAAGVHGTILALDDTTARLEIAPDVVITIERRAIGTSQHAAAPAADDAPPDPPATPADATADPPATRPDAASDEATSE